MYGIRLFTVLMGMMLPLCAHSAYEWRASGGEILIELNTGLLEPLGIRIEAPDALSSEPAPAPAGYLRLRFAGRADDSLRVDAPGLSIEDFSGRLSYRGGLVLKTRDRTVDLTGFSLVPHNDHRFDFNLVDRNGLPWFRLAHVHYQLVEDGAALELRNMGMIMLEPMADFTGMAGVVGQTMGAAHARAPISERPPAQAPLGQCTSPNWATEPGYDNQVTLIALENASWMRCQDCDGSTGGPVVFAPSARLKNEGTADVPWRLQFTGNFPPYGNDQHPYLIWNLYRQDGDGRLEQIAASGLKHAFFSTNTNCPCPGGNILWTTCEDTYTAANNDAANHLAPRGGIIPATGQWGRCRSFFDPECDGVQSHNSGTNSHLNRLNVLEADLDSSGDPGATYFMEAWYVVRDNSDIYAAMGWRGFQTEWNGSLWPATLVGDFVQGPFIDHWVDPVAPDPGQMNTEVNTPHGRLKVAVRTQDLGGGYWRYDYAVANFDYMTTRATGVEPDLQIIENIGITGLRIPIAATVDITAADSARADRTTGQDWEFLRTGQAALWRDPGDTPLDWGLLYRFSLTADVAPVEGVLELLPPGVLRDRFESDGHAAPSVLTVSTLVPGE